MPRARRNGPSPPAPRPQRERGRSLFELLLAVALLGMVGAIAVPAMGRALDRWRLRSASRHMLMLIRRVQMEAAIDHRYLGIVFDRSAGFRYSVYRDGNGNGIRTADIGLGIDEHMLGPVSIEETWPGVEVRILGPGTVPNIPPETGSIQNPGDPVKFGPSDIISCSPLGSCSPGTLYLSVADQRMAAVRIIGLTGRARLFEYEPLGRRWDQR